ncbi:hypothetical protein F5X99DRAFT_391125, partial [Biscogniauxia marginata]
MIRARAHSHHAPAYIYAMYVSSAFRFLLHCAASVYVCLTGRFRFRMACLRLKGFSRYRAVSCTLSCSQAARRACRQFSASIQGKAEGLRVAFLFFFYLIYCLWSLHVCRRALC